MPPRFASHLDFSEISRGLRHPRADRRAIPRRVESADIPDEFDYAALGYTLHNVYGAVESYFLRIARFFENNLDQSAWHRSLVERMTLDIHGIRPARHTAFNSFLDALKRELDEE